MKQKYITGLVILNIFVFSVITVLGVIMLFHSSYAIPTAWNGATATSFAGGDGTSSNPYLISNGGQLAYFIKKCNEDFNYRNKNYKLTADITLNDGYFDYKNEYDFYYFKNNIKYYISGNKYYNFSNQQQAGTLKQLPVSNFVFNGSLDGDGHYVYGLYIYSDSATNECGFLNNVGSSGVVKNIKVINSAIIGNAIEMGFIGTMDGGKVESVIYSGLIRNLGIDYNIGYSSISGNTIYLNSVSGSYASSVKYILKGVSDKSFTYNGQSYDSGPFYIEFSTRPSSVTLQSSETLNLSDVSYYLIEPGNSAGFIGISYNSVTLDKCAISGKVIGTYGFTGGLIGCVFNGTNNNITRSYNSALVTGIESVGGVVGDIDQSASLNLTNVFNVGKVGVLYPSALTSYTGGLIGTSHQANSMTLKFRYCFNHSSSSLDGQFVGYAGNTSIITATSYNHYTTNNTRAIGNYSGTITNITYRSWANMTVRWLKTMQYNDYEPNGVSPDTVWTLTSGSPPYLYFEYKTAPSVEVRARVTSSNYLTWTHSNNSRTLSVVANSSNYKNVTISASTSNSSEIAFIEYYVDNNYSTTPLPMDFSNFTNAYSSAIDISNNFCTTVYVRVTDIYGNVNYAFTDIILNDNYKGSPYVETESDSIVTATDAAMSDSVFNVSFKRYYTKSSGDSFPYGSDEKVYLMLANKIPSGTDLILFDKNTHKNYKCHISTNITYINYTSGGKTYYLLDLANFWYAATLSNSNNITYYDSDVSNSISGDTYNLDIVISFVFPSNLSSNYNFYQSNKHTNLVDYSSTSSSVLRYSYNVDTVIAKKSDYTQTGYSLTDSNDSSTSSSRLSLDNLDVSQSVYLTLTRNLYNNSINSTSMHIKSKRDYFRKFRLEIIFRDNNALITSPFVGSNLQYKFVDSNGEKIFNNKSDSVAYVDFDVGDWDSLNGQYNFRIDVTPLNNNYRNLPPATNHHLQFNLLFPNGEYYDFYTQYVTLTSPVMIDNYSFSSSINDSNRVIDSVTGKNLSGTNESNYSFNYSQYDGNSQNMVFLIGKSNDTNGLFAEVSPSTLLNSSCYTIVNSNTFTLNSVGSCSRNSNCVATFKFKTNITPGSYVVKGYLNRGGKYISRDQFNFIVK